MTTKVSNPDTLLDMALESPEMAPFAMFNIDLTECCHPNGELMFPELAASSRGPVWLWEIRSNGENEVDRKREDSQDASVAHQMRVEAMAARVEAGLSALREVDEAPHDDAPQDEWERFWCGESPTQKMAHYRGDE